MKKLIKILRYFFAVQLILSGIFMIFTESIFGGIFIMISGLILFDPTFEILIQKIKSERIRKFKYVFTVLSFFIGILFSMNTDSIKENEFKEKYKITQSEFNLLSKNQQDSIIKVADSIKLAKEHEEYLSNQAIERQNKIKSQFNEVTGEHKELGKLVRMNMHDPYSFEAVKTSYVDNGTSIYVIMQYRGKNGFGALVLESIEASCDLNGNVIKIFNQN